YVYNPATPANEHTSRTINAFADRRWHASDAMSVSVGAEGGVRGIDSNNLGVHQDASAGLFAAATWGKGALDLRGAGHADYDPAYGLEVTPQIYGALDVGTAVLHGGVARAVRAPNYIERYFNTTLESPRGRSLGNPDLQPERAWSAEAGVTWEALQDVRLHLTGFRRVTRDLIDYAMASPSDTVFLARNLHRVEARGAEAEIEARGRIGNSIVSFTSSYTLLDADLGEVSEGVSFKYALTHARHLVQSTFSVNHGRWGAGTRALYKDPIDGDAYFVAHLHAGYVVPLSRGRLTISTELRNVFDVDYADVFDAPMPGRWWMAGLRWAP
ncbi:MAG: TonB-dependent receptor, partial [Rhodothermales bacterium]